LKKEFLKAAEASDEELDFKPSTS